MTPPRNPGYLYQHQIPRNKIQITHRLPRLFSAPETSGLCALCASALKAFEFSFDFAFDFPLPPCLLAFLP
jgi:hypothetical protein